MRSIKFLGFAIFFLVVQFGAQSQSDPSPTTADQSKTVLRANTRLVVVDVVATDNKGGPVANLTKDDFTIIEDGRQQTISIFNFQKPGPIPIQPSQHLPPNVFSNVPGSKPTSLNVVLLDALNGEFSGRAYAREQLIKFLEEGGSSQPIAVYALENHLKLLHDFTTDPREAVSAIRGYKPQVQNHIENVYATASPFTQKGEIQTGPRSIESTLAALDFLAQALAGYPGRKNLIWLSEGFPMEMFPDLAPSAASISTAHNTVATDTPGYGNPISNPGEVGIIQASQTTNSTLWANSDYAAAVKRVANALMNAQVAAYPIDAAGVSRLSRISNLSTMREMAERTGGKAFSGQNNLQASIRSSIDDGSTYYTLAYYPDNKNWDGHVRQIEVKTGRSGVTLRYRQGYYALDPEASGKPEDSKKLVQDFSRALAMDAPSATAILFQTVLASPVDNKEKVVANFAIDPHTLTFAEETGGVHQFNLSCAVVAFSDKGSLIKDTLSTMTPRLSGDDFQKLIKTTFPCRVTVELKPGKYLLRLGVVDRTSRMMGTTTALVTVPIP